MEENSKLLGMPDVIETPVDEYIRLVKVVDEREQYCRFCGRRLKVHRQGIGRDVFYEASECDCIASEAARAHNKLQRVVYKWRNSAIQADNYRLFKF